jgi:hypothetical protein
MRCDPNWVSTGPCTTPTSFSKTTRSNSFTIIPGLNVPKFPPRDADGHSLTLDASSENADCKSLAPSSSVFKIFNFVDASGPVTRICLADASLLRLERNLNASWKKFMRSERRAGEEEESAEWTDWTERTCRGAGRAEKAQRARRQQSSSRQSPRGGHGAMAGTGREWARQLALACSVRAFGPFGSVFPTFHPGLR